MFIYLNNVNDLQCYLLDGRKLFAQKENSSIEPITTEKVNACLFFQYFLCSSFMKAVCSGSMTNNLKIKRSGAEEVT